MNIIANTQIYEIGKKIQTNSIAMKYRKESACGGIQFISVDNICYAIEKT